MCSFIHKILNAYYVPVLIVLGVLVGIQEEKLV
jgi:hypothetical protein